MIIKQISVFLENKSGRLAAVTDVLAKANINILALSIADTTNFGILRLIVCDYARAEKVLKDAGLTVKATDVFGVAMEHTPGGLHDVVAVMADQNIEIEYMYAFVGKHKECGYVIIKTDQNDRAISALKQAHMRLVSNEDLQEL